MIECLTPWNIIWNFFNAHQCSDIYNSTSLADPVTFLEYLPYFLKTFILELPVYLFFLRHHKKLNEILQINSILNFATHPIVFFLIPLILLQFNATYLHYLVIAEVFAPLVEALLLIYAYKVGYGRAFLAGIAANLFSWSLGIYWV
ncbi:MAG: hypothetical protein ABL930_01615 [Pseudobdellovibrio sp.]